MKIRSCILAVIVLAQLGWITYNYVQCSNELEKAPRIVMPSVDARSRSYSYYSDFSVGSVQVSLYNENPVLGKSFWWSNEWTEEGPETPWYRDALLKEAVAFTPRPEPGADVQGARKIGPKDDRGYWSIRTMQDKEFKKRCYSVIWTKDEASNQWRYRLEVPGSSEDVLREGELRTYGVLRDKNVLRSDNNDTYVCLEMGLFYHPSMPWYSASVSYTMNRDMRRVYREWCSRHDLDKRDARLPKVEIEVALRENKPAVATDIKIDGMSLTEAIALMDKDEFPVPEQDKSAKSSEKENNTPEIEEDAGE